MRYGIAGIKGGGGVSNTMLTTTTDATETSGTYTLDLTYLSDTPKVNDYVVYVNSGNLTTLYQVSAIGSTETTLTKIGDIGGGAGSGATLYQHNLFISGMVGSTYIYAMTQVLSDSSLPFVNTTDYVEGTNQKLAKWLYDNGFNDNTTIAKAYQYNVQYLGSTNRLGLISTDGSSFKVWKSGSGGFSSENYSVAQIQDTVIELISLK